MVTVSISVAWRVALAVALAGSILVSVCARAPRRSVPTSELRRLVACALILYVVGGLASLSHHSVLAGLVYGAGIIVSALAAWLSRGRDQEDPPRGGDEPVDEQPPPRPDGLPWLDWNAFEREFREYSERVSDPAAGR